MQTILVLIYGPMIAFKVGKNKYIIWKICTMDAIGCTTFRAFTYL